MANYYSSSSVEVVQNQLKFKDILVIAMFMTLIITVLVMFTVLIATNKEPTYYEMDARIINYTTYIDSVIHISYVLLFNDCVKTRNITCNFTQNCPDKNYSNNTVINIYVTSENSCDYVIEKPNQGLKIGEIVVIVFVAMFLYFSYLWSSQISMSSAT
jgi:hypothetical protein